MDSQNVENSFLVDALSFTSKSDSLGDVLDLLDMRVTWENTFSFKGYKNRMYYCGVSVHYESDNPNQHIWVEMSGQGVRAYESFGRNDIEGLLRWVLASDQRKLTRLDIAFDDHTGVIDLHRMYTDLGERNYVSSCRSWTREDNAQGGMTLYLGSKHSDMFFRVYDKAVERGYSPDELHWVRLELQLRDDYALSFVNKGFDFGKSLFSVLDGLWRFVSPPEDSDDTNKRRWPVAEWWNTLMSGVEACTLYIAPGLDYNASKLEHYVVDMAGQSIACYVECYGWEALYSKLREAYAKMLNKERYTDVIDSVRAWQ